MNVWSLLQPDDHDRARDIVTSRESGDHAVSTYEAKFRTKDGETRYGEFSVRRTNYEGRPTTTGSVRDVTDRKRTEDRLQALIEHSYDLFALVDESGVFRYHGPSIERFG
jgi:PAS domain S-box-containing protein